MDEREVQSTHPPSDLDFKAILGGPLSGPWVSVLSSVGSNSREGQMGTLSLRGTHPFRGLGRNSQF